MVLLPLVPFTAKTTCLSVMENTNVRRFTEAANAFPVYVEACKHADPTWISNETISGT